MKQEQGDKIVQPSINKGFSTSMKTKHGFTLIELLVVITIIAILSVIAMVAYSKIQASARDSKRQSDLKMIQSALEDYHADQIYYPTGLTFGAQLAAGSKVYMTTVPSDPLTAQQYAYAADPPNCDNSGTFCTSYCLYAKMEWNIPPSNLGNPSCPPSGSYNYGVTRP